MDGNEYEYEVAFSFLAQDEPLAIQLNDLLQDRVKTFLYSEQQKRIAGTDGEKTFGLVFGEQARLVVVLYRNGWGGSPWTRIEETAIRNRAHELGYDFVIVIPLDKTASVPQWLPRNRIWVGLERWGMKGAAGVIEARIQELGGEPHEETLKERAARLERANKFQQRRKQFLHSHEGVNAANAEYLKLHQELKELIAEIKTAAPSIPISLDNNQGILVITGSHGVSVCWRSRFSNMLDDDSQLEIRVWTGYPPVPGAFMFDKADELENRILQFDLLPTEQVGWVLEKECMYTTHDLAQFILKFYLDNQA